MEKQIIRILLVVAILVGSMNLSAAYFSKKEDTNIKTLPSRKLSTAKAHKIKKAFNRSHISLLQ
ncbi:MAG: hypothetical protein PF638_08995 [Candidatus Delongbacteria bacterium]|jgi:ribose 5-phosphate isomerase RpiB|nr:hypothetical protein [Candidatus Delongbacteria bacterium]